MGCVVAGCLSLIFGRLFLLIVWIFSNWFNRAFDEAWEWAAPLVGLFFLPVTVLYVSAVENWWGGDWGFWQVAGAVLAFMIDTSSVSSQRKRNSKQES